MRGALPQVGLLALLLLAASGCRVAEEREREPVERTAGAEEPAEALGIEASAPFGPEEITADRLEAERLDPSWQRYARENLEARRMAPADSPSRSAPEPEEGAPAAAVETEGNAYLARMQGAPPSTSPGAPTDRSRSDGDDAPPADGPTESWEGISAEALRTGEPRFPVATDGGGPTVFRVQWLLDRAGFSPGVLDGRWGKNTEKAVYWLQQALDLEPTGRMDRALYERLDAAVREVGEREPVLRYVVSAGDLEGPFRDVPDDPEAQARLECLCYASPQELLAEKFHTTGELLARLNPEADLANLREGTELWVPAVEVVEPGEAGEGGPPPEVARIVISKGGFYLHALDEAGNLLYHFPSTMGSRYNPSPEGRFRVDGVGWRPEFHYQPELLTEAPDVEEDLLLPPGPNSPVGLVWMQLSKPHYGIHGTARPETIGYTTSHGCIRLTNWDAVFLGHRVSPGTPVEFRP